MKILKDMAKSQKAKKSIVDAKRPGRKKTSTQRRKDAKMRKELCALCAFALKNGQCGAITCAGSKAWG
jgi:hypothetical protein